MILQFKISQIIDYTINYLEVMTVIRPATRP